MSNLTTLASNDDDVLSSTEIESKVNTNTNTNTNANINININMYPLIGLMLAFLSGAISVGAGYLVYTLVFSN